MTKLMAMSMVIKSTFKIDTLEGVHSALDSRLTLFLVTDTLYR